MNMKAPTWAKSAIVAQLKKDKSDIQTDYFNSITVREVFLAWSKHRRDMFAEMRKAAMLFKETRFMGPGRDDYEAIVILDTDIPNSNGSAYWKGSISHWHNEAQGDSLGKHFETIVEAEAFVSGAGEPHDIGFGDITAKFKWEIRHHSLEQRQKWSMGSGYFLGHDKYSGWNIRKVNVEPGQDVSWTTPNEYGSTPEKEEPEPTRNEPVILKVWAEELKTNEPTEDTALSEIIHYGG